MPRSSSRRTFIKAAAATGLGLSIRLPSAHAKDSNDRLRLACVGCGGRGWVDLSSIAAASKVDVTALCDVDSGPKNLGRAAETYRKAARYSDWRKLLDDEKSFDAVIVATPDHMHAPIAMAAMQRGKHVYCQKPLTHTVFEARQMRLAANKAKVVTQMGNQIQSHVAYRTAVAIVRDGAIGKVKEVHSWQSGTMKWLLESDRPAGEDPIPAELSWNDWLGVAPVRPYKTTIYHPFNWRAWQDFGTGQLGDFGCHILDPVFMALDLTAPRTVSADAPPLNREVWGKRATVRYQFPATERTAGETLPLTWYEGEGAKPAKDALGVGDDFELPRAGSMLIGEKGSLLVPHFSMPTLLPEKKFEKYKMPKPGDRNHFISWADACRGDGETTSPFNYAGPLTEAVLLGTVAIRVPGETLHWDAEALKITNSTAANDLLTKPYRKGWEPEWV